MESDFNQSRVSTNVVCQPGVRESLAHSGFPEAGGAETNRLVRSASLRQDAD